MKIEALLGPTIPETVVDLPVTHRRHVQSRVDSFAEAVTNTAIGFTISMVTWAVVAWDYGIPMTWGTNLQITGIFTVVSIARQYVLRRVFDGRSPWTALKGLVA
jgi:hypothetical protein